jgi:hypothetical protein
MLSATTANRPMQNQADTVEDPFLIDTDRLRQLAPEAIVRDGLDGSATATCPNCAGASPR